MPAVVLEDPARAPAEHAVIDLSTEDCQQPPRLWASADYLLWWVKDAPLSVPIVTTGDPNVGFPTMNTAGALGQPGTAVLLGDSSLNFKSFSGMRFTLGGWVDPQQTMGIEGSGFVLERRTNQFAAASDASGNPPLYFPRFNSFSGTEGGFPIADPLRGFAGDVLVSSSLRLWGAEVNGCLNVAHRPGLEVSVLAGFRYADLTESLNINNTTSDLIFLNNTTQNDFFGTRNQFYGGQLGARLGLQRDRFSLDATGKVALGATHQVVDIQGNSTQLGPNPLVPPGLGTFPGGFYAQPSNIGRRDSNDFTVLPSVELKVGYQLTSGLRATVGYDFLYWNQVVRPGAVRSITA